jgi:GGDEF domain-containing protein/CheY-like chemotaxis protein
MMAQLVDLNARDGQHTRSLSFREGTPYALVADTDPQRIEECLAAIRPFKLEAFVARNGQDAVAILERRGTPRLLIVDLSLPHKDGSKDGFTVIDAIPMADRRRVAMIAWSSRRELREFAVHRLAGLQVRILGGAVAPSVLRSAIEAVLPNRGTQESGARASAATGADLHESMAELSDKAQRLCGTAGVAVYLRGSDDAQFRTSVTWLSDTPLPHPPVFLPSVFEAVLATGESFFRTDVTTAPVTGDTTGVVRGLGAVPLIDLDGQIVGAMCVFDLNLVAFDSSVVDALRALGRNVSVAADTQRPVVEQRLQSSTPPPAENATPPAPPVIPPPLLDRVAGDAAVTRELVRLRREQRHLSVVRFDIEAVDRGDQNEGLPSDPVESVIETLMKAIRGSDLAIRWTSKALLVVLPGLGLTEARPVAERVRAALAAGARQRLAVAGGVAELLPDEPFDSVVARADHRVRMARERGHNRVA